MLKYSGLFYSISKQTNDAPDRLLHIIANISIFCHNMIKLYADEIIYWNVFQDVILLKKSFKNQLIKNYV